MPPPQPKRGKHSPNKRLPKTAPADLPPQPLDDFPPRLPTETPVAYDRFCQYLLLPIPRAASRLGDKGLIHRWRSAHAWVERAALFDAARRKLRLDRLTEAQLERDVLTLEADGRLADLARGLLFGEGEPRDSDPPDALRPLLHALTQIARAGQNDNARIAAIDKLVDYSGIGDLRKLRAKQLALPFGGDPPKPTDQAGVVAALAEHATPQQLDALCGGPVVDDPAGSVDA